MHSAFNSGDVAGMRVMLPVVGLRVSQRKKVGSEVSQSSIGDVGGVQVVEKVGTA